MRTTLELVIAELVGTAFDRPLDPRTGYAELSISSSGPDRHGKLTFSWTHLSVSNGDNYQKLELIGFCLIGSTRMRIGGKWSPESIAAEMAKLRKERDAARSELEQLRVRL